MNARKHSRVIKVAILLVCVALCVGCAAPASQGESAGGAAAPSSGAATSFDLSQLNRDLVAYYSFDGNANDASGNGNHGTVNGATLTADRHSNPNSAYEFDGEDDSISFADSPDLHLTDQVSLAAWVFPIVQKTQEIVLKGPYLRGPDASPYGLSLSATGDIIFELRLRPNLELTQVRKSGYPLNEWFLVIGTYDGTRTNLYVNGALVNSLEVSGTLNESLASLLVGTRLGLNADTFQGRIDEVRIYRRSLTATEVQALYTGAPFAAEEVSPVVEAKPTVSEPEPQETNYLSDILLAEGQKHQEIQFNPDAALQKRVFTDAYVPNSDEFDAYVENIMYRAQRAEQLDSGEVRIYYAQVGDWGNIQIAERSHPRPDSPQYILLQKGEGHQLIQFNPDAALQKQIFADGFVPNSDEFDVEVGGVPYMAQRAEHLGTGEVRVYYVQVGDWENVLTVTRTTERLVEALDGTQIVVDGTGHTFGPLPVIFYAVTDPTGQFYRLNAPDYPHWIFFGLFDSGSAKVVINGRKPQLENGVLSNPNRVGGLNWEDSDAGHMKLVGGETVHLRLTGLHTQQDDRFPPVGSPDSEEGAQLEVRDISVKVDPNLNVTLIGAPVVNQIVAHIDYTDLANSSWLNDANYWFHVNVTAPSINLYWPGDPRIPASDLTLQLEPFGNLESTDGVTPGQRYWLRNVAFQSSGNVVSDQQREYDFLFDTGTTVTIVGDRVANGLDLSSTSPSFDCYGGTGNGYVLDGVTMVGSSGSYQIKNAAVCWANDQVQMGDAVIGSNFFDQVQVILDGPNEVLGIKNSG